MVANETEKKSQIFTVRGPLNPNIIRYSLFEVKQFKYTGNMKINYGQMHNPSVVMVSNLFPTIIVKNSKRIP
jgi:hypothetical protein